MKIVCRSNSHLKSTRVWNLQHEEMSVRELSEDRGGSFLHVHLPPCRISGLPSPVSRVPVSQPAAFRVHLRAPSTGAWLSGGNVGQACSRGRFSSVMMNNLQFAARCLPIPSRWEPAGRILSSEQDSLTVPGTVAPPEVVLVAVARFQSRRRSRRR